MTEERRSRAEEVQETIDRARDIIEDVCERYNVTYEEIQEEARQQVEKERDSSG